MHIDLYMIRNHVNLYERRYNCFLDYPQYSINKTTKYYKVQGTELVNKLHRDDVNCQKHLLKNSYISSF